MEPSEAIARYKQRKSGDARTPLDNAGDFEEDPTFLFCELGLCPKDNGAKKRTIQIRM
jgi:hypothetical protein